MSDRAVRTLRGVGAAVVCTLTAALSHSLADGHMASGFAVVVALTASVFVCIALAGRRLSPGRLALAVVLSQGAYHAMFAFAPAGAVTVTTHSSAAGVHAAHTIIGLDMDVAASAHHHGAMMWLAHLVAAAVTFWALRRGERTAIALLELLRVAVDHLVRVPEPVSLPRRRAAAFRVRWAPPNAPVLSSCSQRGPPVAA